MCSFEHVQICVWNRFRCSYFPSYSFLRWCSLPPPAHIPLDSGCVCGHPLTSICFFPDGHTCSFLGTTVLSHFAYTSRQPELPGKLGSFGVGLSRWQVGQVMKTQLFPLSWDILGGVMCISKLLCTIKLKLGFCLKVHSSLTSLPFLVAPLIHQHSHNSSLAYESLTQGLLLVNPAKSGTSLYRTNLVQSFLQRKHCP